MNRVKIYKFRIFGLIVAVSLAVILSSCGETEQQQKARIQREEQQRIEIAQKAEQRRIEQEKIAEQERLEKERQAEQERIAQEEKRKQQEIYDRFINSSLRTGATPYSKFYGSNSSCNSYGCSEIRVKTPQNSDVLVTIKKNNKVVRHAYIRAASSYTFQMSNGTYQPFFYYGKSWNPEKAMKELDKSTLKGGFIANESFGKDDPQYLNNQILEYELILQQNGNFSTRPSNVEDAL
jgi:hypothetical protein